jgi:hypothetical protein
MTEIKNPNPQKSSIDDIFKQYSYENKIPENLIDDLICNKDQSISTRLILHLAKVEKRLPEIITDERWVLLLKSKNHSLLSLVVRSTNIPMSQKVFDAIFKKYIKKDRFATFTNLLKRDFNILSLEQKNQLLCPPFQNLYIAALRKDFSFSREDLKKIQLANTNTCTAQEKDVLRKFLNLDVESFIDRHEANELFRHMPKKQKTIKKSI